MEVKTILEKIRHEQKEKKEYFFAVQLEENLVKSALWTVENGVVKVLAVGETQIWRTEEELLKAIDASLPQEEEIEPQKVIFGVTPEWVQENRIVKDKLELLKKICKELELSPVGFVVTQEAIVYQLKTTEGVPLTAILVNRGERKIRVASVRLGKIIGSQLVDKSSDLGADIAEGLSRFGPEETFPSRILLYNMGESLEEEKQQLIDYSWGSMGIGFHHLPKIETLPSDFDVRSVAVAGGREGVKMEEEEKKEETAVMGFVKGKDISQERQPEPEVIPEEVKKEAVEEKEVIRIKEKIAKVFALISKVRPRMAGGLLSGRFPLVGILTLVFLIILGGIFISLWWYLPKAEVTLFIKPKVLEKDFTIRLDPNLNAPDKEKLALPAKEEEEVLESEKTIQTTGTKLVGEPAKGEVVIYNGTSKEKVFEAGTTIANLAGIKFTLDEKVTVASQSGTAADPVPGKATAKLTAVEIGAEGNLASGTEFTIANFSKSDYVAKNEGAFTGGTSREVQVVAKKDQERLTEELTKELQSKALQGLKEKISLGKKLIEESLISKVIEKTFSKEAEAEANELTLKLKLRSSALIFDEEEFRELVDEEIRKAVPKGFEYRSEESEFSFSLKEISKEGLAIFSAHFKANLFPQLDVGAIQKNLVGKKPEIGGAYLGSLPSVDSFEVKIHPNLPAKLATFPRVVRNIKIEVRKR